MFYTIQAIKDANKAAGYHFFDPDTLRFFDSRILGGVIGDGYFVTSERYDYDSPRLYTVRRANADGSIDTVGEFQQFKTARAARNTAQALVASAQYARCPRCHAWKPALVAYNAAQMCTDCAEVLRAES